MRICKKCVLPDTRPGVSFDENGVCDACRWNEVKYNEIDWEARKKEFGEILEKYRSKDGNEYDCIIPVSGGKDSTFQTYVIKRIFGLNPLLVTFAPCQSRELGKRNLKNLIEELEVDHILFTPNRSIYKKLFRLGLGKLGDPCWPCHVGIVTYPMQVAIQYQIPLIIWGESGAFEYGGLAETAMKNTLDVEWVNTFGGPLGTSAEDWFGEGLSPANLKPYMYPSNEEIKKLGVVNLYLGYYMKWDARRQLEVITEKCNFKIADQPRVGSLLNYENLDCGFVGIHDYLCYLKYGFGRATTQACIDIRNKRMTREEALKKVEEYDGKLDPKELKGFCDFVGINEDEFWKTSETFRGKDAWMKNNNGEWVKKIE